MKRVLLVMTFTALVLTLSGALMPPSERSWLLQVRSKYKDEATGAEIWLQGTGTLLKTGKRFVVLTASHVSQGEELEIRSGDGSIHYPIKSRVARNLRDLEVLEVENPKGVEPLAVFQTKDRLFEVPVERAQQWHSLVEYLRRGTERHPSVPSYQMVDWSAVIPIAPWVKAGTHPDQSRAHFHARYFQDQAKRNALGWTIDGRERISNLKVTRGTSGAPVISIFYPKLRQDGGSGLPYAYAVTGVVSRTQRFTEFSHFASPWSVADLIDELERLPSKKRNGKKNVLDDATWHLRNQLTYRRTGSGISEISSLTFSAGNGTSADGGDLDLTEDLEKNSLQSGIEIGGAPCLAFEVREKRNGVGSFVLNASLPSWIWLKKNESAVSWSPVGTRADFFQILRKKLSLDEAAVKLVSENGSELELLQSELKLKIIDSSAGDELLISLDKQGSAFGEGRFKPVIEVVSSRSRKAYWVDLTNLFFFEPSYERWSFSLNQIGEVLESGFLKSQLSRMVERSRTASVRYRVKDENRMDVIQDFEVGFSRRKIK